MHYIIFLPFGSGQVPQNIYNPSLSLSLKSYYNSLYQAAVEALRKIFLIQLFFSLFFPANCSRLPPSFIHREMAHYLMYF